MRENLTALTEFMTEEEKQQMAETEALLKRVEDRKRKREYDCGEHQFMFLGCQCECHEGMEQQKQENQKKISFESDLQQLLQQICDFCKRHRICFVDGSMEDEREKDEKEKDEKEKDEGLPF